MVTTYILSIEDFTNRADITRNIQTDILKSYIGVIQEQFAVKILCIELYNELLTQIANDNLSTANAALLPVLKDYLIYKTYRRYLLNANALSTPSGIRVQTDTTTEPASDKFVSELMQQAAADANFYQDTLVNFLKLNSEDYPLWTNSNCGCSDKYTFNKNQFSGIGKSIHRNERVDWT